MQKSHNHLKEIIWEISDNCHQNCSYCGSKDTLNKTKIDHEQIKKLVDRIAAYPPEDIDISGGNPLLVPFKTHEYLTNTLQDKGVTCKIIVNPFNKEFDGHDTYILDLYDWIGVSINTRAEADKFVDDWNHKDHCTMITNFNIGNVFQFKHFESIALMYNLTWQIQFTMYKDDSEMAVYSNEDALNFLWNAIKASKASIIVADNMHSDSGCYAGKHSMGIFANGDVVPCLSMRSWEDNVKVIGNLYEEPLKDIWVRRFADWRCSDFKCCKDHCASKVKEPVLTTTATSDTVWVEPAIPTIKYPSTPGIIPNQVIMYGVQVQPPTFPMPIPKPYEGTFVYAVFRPAQEYNESMMIPSHVDVYGVAKPNTPLSEDSLHTESPEYDDLSNFDPRDLIDWSRVHEQLKKDKDK